jgi:hypothetical protein
MSSEMEKTLRILKQESYLEGWEDSRQSIVNLIQAAHDNLQCSQVAVAVCSCRMSILLAQGYQPWEDVKKELGISNATV